MIHKSYLSVFIPSLVIIYTDGWFKFGSQKWRDGHVKAELTQKISDIIYPQYTNKNNNNYYNCFY